MELSDRVRLVLSRKVARARRGGGQIAVLLFDLDNCKDLNDRFGPEAGERVLWRVAQRLKQGVRAGETVSRLAGAAFVVVLEDLSSERDAVDAMQRLMGRVAEAIDVGGEPFYPFTSAGLAIFPGDGRTPEALLREAGLCVGLARRAGSAYASGAENAFLGG